MAQASAAVAGLRSAAVSAVGPDPVSVAVWCPLPAAGLGLAAVTDPPRHNASRRRGSPRRPSTCRRLAVPGRDARVDPAACCPVAHHPVLAGRWRAVDADPADPGRDAPDDHRHQEDPDRDAPDDHRHRAVPGQDAHHHPSHHPTTVDGRSAARSPPAACPAAPGRSDARQTEGAKLPAAASAGCCRYRLHRLAAVSGPIGIPGRELSGAAPAHDIQKALYIRHGILLYVYLGCGSTWMVSM